MWSTNISKLEGMPAAVDLLRQNDWLTKIYLKYAYFAVNIAPAYRKYLKFQWKGKTWAFKVLPFGLASAPRVFTKILKPVMALLMRVGVRILARRHVAHASTMPNVCDTNKNSSLVASEAGISNKQTEIGSGANEKSGIHRLRNQHSTDETVLANRESRENKGRMLRVTVSEVNKCQETGQNNWQNDSRSESNLTSTTAISTRQRLRTVGLQQNHQSYETVVTLNAECLEELKWWMDHIDVWNGKSCLRASLDLALEIQTDASKTGWGAHCKGIKTQGLRTPSEKTLRINVLELKAVLFAVKAFTKNKSDCHIHVKVDNTTTVAYINKMGGTKSPNLMSVTKDLWAYCISKMIMITVEHVPGNLNQIADTRADILGTAAIGSYRPRFSSK